MQILTTTNDMDINIIISTNSAIYVSPIKYNEAHFIGIADTLIFTQNKIEINYQTDGTVPKYNRKSVEGSTIDTLKV